MMREIDLMKELGVHPHIVNLVGYVPLESPLIVMEYCANGDLLNYLRTHLSAYKVSVESVRLFGQRESDANRFRPTNVFSLCAMETRKLHSSS